MADDERDDRSAIERYDVREIGDGADDGDAFDRPTQNEDAGQEPPRAARLGAYRRSPRSLAPDVAGAPGSIAIAQGQIFIIGAILIAQLFLITTALYELLSGRTQLLWWIAGASLVGFVVALVVTLWPRRARDNF
ncbi:MAG TPA: hypothetical protein VMV29_21235 [Ktedonobacterales bacterium]|nr:hypothetical protein [Ktedonobacterales bacterium]